MDLSDIDGRGLVLLGCGKMGSALLEGWLGGGLPPAAVSVLEPGRGRARTGGGRAGAERRAAGRSPAVALLAVKPQTMGAALPRLAALGDGATLFVSIAAGTPIGSLEAALGAAPRSCGRCRTRPPRSVAASPRWSATPTPTRGRSPWPRR